MSLARTTPMTESTTAQRTTTTPTTPMKTTQIKILSRGELSRIAMPTPKKRNGHHRTSDPTRSPTLKPHQIWPHHHPSSPVTPGTRTNPPARAISRPAGPCCASPSRRPSCVSKSPCPRFTRHTRSRRRI